MAKKKTDPLTELNQLNQKPVQPQPISVTQPVQIGPPWEYSNQSFPTEGVQRDGISYDFWEVYVGATSESGNFTMGNPDRDCIMQSACISLNGEGTTSPSRSIFAELRVYRNGARIWHLPLGMFFSPQAIAVNPEFFIRSGDQIKLFLDFALPAGASMQVTAAVNLQPIR